jgi:hypothetical protein
MWYRCAMGHGSNYMSTIQPKKIKDEKVASSSKWQLIFAI